MKREQYYQVAVEPINPDRYMTPTINVICRPSRLKSEVSELEHNERVRAKRVYDDLGQAVPEILWR